MSTLPTPAGVLPDFIAILDDDARTQFFADNPDFTVLYYSGAAWHRADMLRRAGDHDGAVAVLQADSDARWRADYAARCAAGKPSITGRIMSGLYGAFRVYFVGLVAAGVATLLGIYQVAFAIHATALVSALIGGAIGAFSAPKGC